jgi:molybdopterin/thiamine biosynthesis adenylyltransferase
MNENMPENNLKNKIVVIGAGGIGRSLALVANEMAKRNLPYIPTLFSWYDPDEVEDSNCWSQGFDILYSVQCLHKVCTLSTDFPNLYIDPHCELLTESNIKEAFSNAYAVFIACDNLETRSLIYHYCFEHGIYFVDMRVNSTTIMVSDSLADRNLLEESLKPGSEAGPTSCLFQYEKDMKRIHTTPMIAANIGYQMLLNHMRGNVNELFEYNF